MSPNKRGIPVDITVYLPDEIARRAKAQNVNLSRILRDALTDQFAEEDTMRTTLDAAQAITLELRTEEGRSYRGRLAAVRIGRGAPDGADVYLRRNGDVVAHRAEDGVLTTVLDPENDLRSILPTAEYIAAMNAIGIVPEVDLDAQAPPTDGPTETVRPSSPTAAKRLRSVPGDLVEPPVSFIKRLAGHGDAPRDDLAVEELPSPDSSGTESEPSEHRPEADPS
jgi:post-segregation antitoxin (ccd killing protein)